ncbi:MAG TPA: hypothetical protein VGF65_11370 [Mycobacterium sp.]
MIDVVFDAGRTRHLFRALVECQHQFVVSPGRGRAQLVGLSLAGIRDVGRLVVGVVLPTSGADVVAFSNALKALPYQRASLSFLRSGLASLQALVLSGDEVMVAHASQGRHIVKRRSVG